MPLMHCLSISIKLKASALHPPKEFSVRLLGDNVKIQEFVCTKVKTEVFLIFESF
jgi:hypothetical protein